MRVLSLIALVFLAQQGLSHEAKTETKTPERTERYFSGLTTFQVIDTISETCSFTINGKAVEIQTLVPIENDVFTLVTTQEEVIEGLNPVSIKMTFHFYSGFSETSGIAAYGLEHLTVHLVGEGDQNWNWDGSGFGTPLSTDTVLDAVLEAPLTRELSDDKTVANGSFRCDTTNW